MLTSEEYINTTYLHCVVCILKSYMYTYLTNIIPTFNISLYILIEVAVREDL